MPRFNLDSFNYNPLTNRSNAAIDSAMKNVDAADARMRERRSSNPKPQSRKSIKRRGAGYRKRNVQQPKPVTGDSITVQAGDSLSAILKRATGSYKNVAEIAKLNGIKDPNKIYVGQKIKIPGYKADATNKPAADSAKPADVKPAVAAAAASVVKDSVVAPKDTTTVVRNDNIPAAPRDSVTITAPADTTSESGYERARAHATQLLREREARKQATSSKHKGGMRIPKYAVDKNSPGLYYLDPNVSPNNTLLLNPDVTLEDRTRQLRRFDATRRFPARPEESSADYVKRLDREIALEDMARKSGAVKEVYPEFVLLSGGRGGMRTVQAIRGATEFDRQLRRNIRDTKKGVNKAYPNPVGTKNEPLSSPTGYPYQPRMDREYINKYGTKPSVEVKPTTAEATTTEATVEQPAATAQQVRKPYISEKARPNTQRNILRRMRGKLEGAIARRRGYKDYDIPSTNKAGSGTIGTNTQSYILSNNSVPRWEVRQMKQATKAKPKPTQSTQSSASSAQSPKPTRTKSRKQKIRGNQSKNNYRQAQRAKRNDKGTIIL